MPKFEVWYSETYHYSVVVEAEDRDEALALVDRNYNAGRYDHRDHADFEYHGLRVNEEFEGD